MDNGFLVISTRRLVESLGLRRAAAILEVEEGELTKTRPAFAKVVDPLLEPAGIVDCDRFNQMAETLLASHHVPSPFEPEFREFLNEGDPRVAWVGTPSMMVASLAVAHRDEHPNASEEERGREVFRSSSKLGIPPDFVRDAARSYLPTNVLDKLHTEALRDVTSDYQSLRGGVA